LATNDNLRHYVQDRLSGVIASAKGVKISGPMVTWKGRRSGLRQHRRWAAAWSPEQIACRLPLDFPDDEEMRISHEAIYQALYVQGRGALRRELTACLRTGRALRMPRARLCGRGKSFVSPEIMISERPGEADDRAVPGHWEGDLILGLRSSAIGTLVERTTRFTILLHLPRMEGHGDFARVKNGPALAGHGAEAVRDAIAATITLLPEQLRRSLTWDEGAGSACKPADRYRVTRVLLQPAKPMATRHERKHEWPPASVFSKRNRSQHTQRGRPGSRGGSPKHQAAKVTELEDTC
jgi:IS30 family transposase